MSRLLQVDVRFTRIINRISVTNVLIGAFYALSTGYFFQIFCRLLIILQNQLFLKKKIGISSECQSVWIQIRPDILSGLIWVQTDCKRYQQTALVDKELRVRTERVATGEPCCQTICFSARVTREVHRHFRDIRVPLILSMRNASNMFILNKLLIRTSSLRIY